MFYSKTTGGFYDHDIHVTIPDDAVEIDRATHAALLAGQSEGKRIVPDPDGFPVLADPAPPTEADLIAAISLAVQSHMDAVAKDLGYDDIKTAVTYADEPAVPKFQAEGQALRAWRSLVWAKCYELLDEVKSGTRGVMTAEEVLAELPKFEMPV